MARFNLEETTNVAGEGVEWDWDHGIRVNFMELDAVKKSIRP